MDRTSTAPAEIALNITSVWSVHVVAFVVIEYMSRDNNRKIEKERPQGIYMCTERVRFSLSIYVSPKNEQK